MVRKARAAALALHRFGLGPRGGAIVAIASDPQGALLTELDQSRGGRIAADDYLPHRALRLLDPIRCILYDS